MAWAHYSAELRNLHAYLVDGCLPEKNRLLNLAEASAKDPALDRHVLVAMPCNLWKHNEDTIYQSLEFNMRKAYCVKRPREKKRSVWTEAWLLNPENGWITEFGLKSQKFDVSSRRLLVALYEGCELGENCLQNLVRKSEFGVIPAEEYRDYKAFLGKAEALLEDIALPFLAPCLVTEERLAATGYDCTAFGS